MGQSGSVDAGQIAELRLSEERYRLALEKAHAGLWDWDISADTLYLSPRWKALLGYEDQELVNSFSTFADLLHDDDRAQLLVHIEVFRADETLGDWVEEFRMRHKDGRWLWIEARATTIRDGSGAAVRMVGTHTDISPRKEVELALEFEREQMVAIFDGIDEVIYVADPETHELLFVNQVVRDLWGEEVIGRRCYEVLQGRDLPCDFCTNDKIFGENVGQTCVWEFKNEVNGRWYRCADKAIRWADGRLVRFELASDITERKLVEESLEHTAEELRRSNADLERFAYIASHDLQEPLRMVASYVGLLERRLGSSLDDECREFMAFAVGGARRMKTLLRGLLDYARVDSRSAPFGPVDLAQIMAAVKRTQKPTIDECGAEVIVKPLPTVWGDASQLEQLLQNLLANALKFRGQTPPRIVIEAGRAETGWRVSVQDNGIGIEPAYHEQIFVVFQRLHTVDRYPGTGIGLAICRRIVERHGGQLTLESALDQGSTFAFTLPDEPDRERLPLR
jgi:PAS domain S-box-containing protein